MKLTTIAKLARNSESRVERSEAALRADIRDANINGLAASGAIVYIGRRVFLDEGKYWAWFESRAKRSATHGAQADEFIPAAAAGGAA